MNNNYQNYFNKLDDQLNNNDDELNNNLENKNLKTQHSNNICTKCNINSIIQDNTNGFMLCKNCGIIKDIIIDNSAEWRYYGNSDNKYLDPSRCGGPINPLLPKSSLGTFIGGSSYGSLQRLHSWNSMPSYERSLWHVFENINRKTQNTDLINKIKEECKYYYKTISEKDKYINGILTRGSVRQGVIAACLFVACKNNNTARLASEIAEMFDITTTDVTKGLKKFCDIEKRKNIELNVNITKTDDFIQRYCNKLNISKTKQKIGFVLAKRVKKIGILNENTPPSIAASIIYLLSTTYHLNISKDKICNEINISNVTITKAVKRLNKYYNILFIGIPIPK